MIKKNFKNLADAKLFKSRSLNATHNFREDEMAQSVDQIHRKLSSDKLAGFFVVFLTFLLTANFSYGSAASYFEPESINVLLIDSPYKEKSPQHLKELAEIRKIQKKVGKSDLEEAAAEREFIPELIANKIDARLSRHSFPKLYTLLDRVGSTSRANVDHFKNHWQVIRPYLYDQTIKPLIAQSAGYSYPSGHTTSSEVYADILTLLIPERRTEFQEIAEKIGWHRIQVGMHYPQDIKAGKQLAELIVGGLLQNKDFQKDLSKAKAELVEAKIIN